MDDQQTTTTAERKADPVVGSPDMECHWHSRYVELKRETDERGREWARIQLENGDEIYRAVGAKKGESTMQAIDRLHREIHGLREGIAIAVRELSTVENDWSEDEYVEFCLKIAADLKSYLETANPSLHRQPSRAKGPE